jgi:predicted O-methyltransferase YrrM
MRFAQEGRTFDFIYVDADRRFDGVLLDTILSWPLLRKGGYLVLREEFPSH